MKFDFPYSFLINANAKIGEVSHQLFAKAKVNLSNAVMKFSEDSDESLLTIANAISPLSFAMLTPPMPPPPNYRAVYDFDGDNRSDVGRWRAGNGEWMVKRSLDSQTQTHALGSSQDLIVPANYDSDNMTDYAVFNAGS
jgi:hypothetical protein